MLKYTMIILWSEEDQEYLVQLPEWREHSKCEVRGDTYEEAAKNGREALELLVEKAKEQGQALETEDDEEEPTIESALEDIIALAGRAEKIANFPRTPTGKRMLRSVADEIKEAVKSLEVAIEKGV